MFGGKLMKFGMEVVPLLANEDKWSLISRTQKY
jgi:hypothetical protein